MKYLILILLTVSSLSVYAHCPVEVNTGGRDYCLGIEWEFGEKRVQGQWETDGNLSPYLIKTGEVPQNWIYSRVMISTWMKGDPNHNAVVIPNFRVFPYMIMKDGVHHSANYEFNYDGTNSIYMVSKMALHQMDGCWSLRWTTLPTDDISSSRAVINVEKYSNLTQDQNSYMLGLCAGTPGVETPAAGGHDHSH